jgi:hypothetical protein
MRLYGYRGSETGQAQAMLNFAKRTKFDPFGCDLSAERSARSKIDFANQSQFCEGNQRPGGRQSQFKPNSKPISWRAAPASATLRPSTHALTRVAQDEGAGCVQKENRFILSHDAEHRESKDARRCSSADQG